MAVLAVLALVASLVPVPVAATGPTASNRAAEGLVSFSRRLGPGLGALPELNERLPLASRSVRELLRLDTIVDDTLGASLAGLATGGDATSGQLESAIGGADLSTAGADGITVDYSAVSVSGGDPMLDIRFSADIRAQRNLPMAYVQTRATPDGEKELVFALVGDAGVSATRVPVDVRLQTTFDFGYDTRVTDPVLAPGALKLDTAPTLSLTATGANAAIDADATYGFADVDVTGSVGFSLATTVGPLTDPDGVNGISREEWENTLPQDLLAPVALLDGPGTDIDVALTLDSPLISGGVDGTLSWLDADRSNGVTTGPALGVESSDLGRFDNVGPDDVLSGLSQFAAATLAAEADGDLPLPFLAGRLSDGYSVGNVLTRFVERQSDAVVTCGKTDTSPPQDPTLPGDTWYCQAYSAQTPKAGTVSWSVAPGGGTIAANGTDDASVGVTPSNNVKLTGVPGEPDVSVTFTDPDIDDGGTTKAGLTHTVDRRFSTAGELRLGLEKALFGSSVPSGQGVTLAYDAATDGLTFAIDRQNDPAAVTTTLDFGDRLREATHLTGLVPAVTADPDEGKVGVDLGSVTFDITFGVDLVEDDPNSTTDGFAGLEPAAGVADTTADRFFAVVDPAAGAFELAVADLAVTAKTGFSLSGNVGYLGVTATSTGFAVAKDQAGAPMVAIDIAPDATGGNGTGVARSVLVRHILDDLDNVVSATPNLQLTAGLSVVPSGSLSSIVSGTPSVAISWDPVTATSQPVVTPDAALLSDLAPFDLAPEVKGASSGATASKVLTDASANFLSAFGLAVTAGAEMSLPLYNRTTGASCEGIRILSATTLQCIGDFDATRNVPGLSGGTVNNADGTMQTTTGGEPVAVNDWRLGDEYEVRGEPKALGLLVVESLYDLANRFANHTGDGFDEPLPLLGRAPRDFVPQFVQVRQKMGALKSALLTPGTGDPDTGVIANPPPPNLQALETVLETELGAGTVAFSLQTLANAVADSSLRHLVVQLGDLTRTGTQDIDGAGGSDLALRLPIGPGDLLLAGNEGQDPDLTASWTSRARLDVGVPIDPSVNPNNVVVLGTTGVGEVQVTASGTALDLTGSYSAMSVKVGAQAFTTGTHKVNSGTHTGAAAATGTADATTVSGTHTATAASTTLLTDSGQDFTALGFVSGGTLTNTTDNVSCTVTAVGTATLTCSAALADSKDFSNGDAYTYSGASTKTLTDAASNFNSAGVDAGMVVENTTGGGWCTVASNTTTSVTCSAALSTGSFASGDSFRITSPTVLEDDNASFTDIGAAVGQTVKNTTDDATCTISDVKQHEITCAGPLTGTGTAAKTWNTGDGWLINVASRLYDPDANPDFDRLNVGAGDPVENTTDGTQCPASATTGDTLSCGSGSVSWDQDDQYKLGTVGVARISVDYDLLAPAQANLDAPADSVGFMDTLVGNHANAATANDCGAGVTGDVCARVSLESDDAGSAYLGVVNMAFDFGDASPTVTRSAALDTARQGGEPLDWALLGGAVPFLGPLVRDNVDGVTSDTSVPLVGSVLDAGAAVGDTADEIADNLSTVGAAMAAPATIGALRTAIADDVKAKLALVTGVTRLNEPTVTALCGATACDDASAQIGTVSDVQVRVSVAQNLAAGTTEPVQGCKTSCGAAEAFDVPFELGIPGFPLTSEAQLKSKVGWSLDLDFGLGRDVGPYLGTSGAGELTLGARVQLDDADNSAECSETKAPDPEATKTPTAGDEARATKPSQYSAGRCFDATAGKLAGTFWDGDTTPAEDADTWTDAANHDRSRLDLLTTVDFAPVSGGVPGKLPLDALVLGEDASTVAADADGNVDLWFQSKTGSPALPVVLGSFHLLYDTEATGDDAPVEQAEYRDMMLDLNAFYSQFLGPILADIKGKTKPIVPFIDAVTAELPVVSDLSKGTGNGPVTVYDLIEPYIARKREQATTDKARKRLDLIRTFLSLRKTIDELGGLQPPQPGPMGFGEVYSGSAPHDAGVRGTGGFKVDTTGMSGSCGETDEGLRQRKDCKRTSTRKTLGVLSSGQRVFGQSGNDVNRTETIKQLRDCPASGCTGKELAKTVTKEVTKGLTGYGLPTFPFLTDANQMYGMLMGLDATLVHMDFGVLHATFAKSVTFGPFMAGPVPVDVSFGFAITVDARLVMGYDTRPFGPEGTGDPIDGIYFDDLDEFGQDVPDVRLLTTVTAGASVSVRVFRVGIEAGVTLGILLDLQDPDRDGKLRFEEIASFGRDPWCMFSARGTIEFFLRFFVEVDLLFWSKRWTFEPWRLKPPLSLFEVKCDPPKPVLAVEESDGDVVLNLGSQARRDARAFEKVKTAEKFTVRQLQPETTVAGGFTRISVTAFGLVQEYKVGKDRFVMADGDSDNDTILLQSGADGAGRDVPFTLDSMISGGPGNDRIETAAGTDTITAGPADDGDGANDRDVVKAGDGNDVVSGGDGRDSLDGGLGHDILRGGDLDDRINGSPGTDVIHGEGGDDDLSGGPGLSTTLAAAAALRRMPAATPAERAAFAATLEDTVDVITGGAGADELKGQFGDDRLFGDGPAGTATDAALLAAPTTISDTTECDATTGTGGSDRIDGEAGSDHVFGGPAADLLSGGRDGDLLCGNGGSDVLEGDVDIADAPGFADDLRGGAGDDRLFGRAGADVLDGGPDRDLVAGGPATDHLKGGTGSDAVLGDDGDDVALGDTGTIPTGATGTSRTGVVPGADVDTGTVVCADSVALVDGYLDIDGDRTGSDAGDDGYFLGLRILDGLVDVDGSTTVTADDNGSVAGSLVAAGRLDENGDGAIGTADDGLRQGTLVVPSAAGSNADCVRGGAGRDALYGGGAADDVDGGDAGDFVFGGTGGDRLRGGLGNDEISGQDGADTIHGDSGDDLVLGGNGDDVVRGGIGNDVVEGNDGADQVFGEAQNDNIIGGSSSSGTPDGADVLDGNIGADVIVGDNGTIASTPVRTVVLLDMATTAGGTDIGAGDAIRGGPDDDRAYGGPGNDLIDADDSVGVAGNDYAEGNRGADAINGGGGNDALVGGSSSSAALDGNVGGAGDTVHGDAGADLIAGDNATITGTDITRLNDATTGDAQDDLQSGDDTLFGDSGSDGIEAGGGNDTVSGGTEADRVQGNAGRDTINGDAGDDQLVGGSDAAATVDENVGGAGDTIHGNDGNDATAGDNATITGTDITRLNDATTGDAQDDLQSGDDTLFGDGGSDGIEAGGGNDTVSGGTEADRVQGNAGRDTISGDAGDDQLVGGSDAATTVDENVGGAGDTIHGDDGNDAIAGDNATITGTDITRLNDATATDADDDRTSGDDVIFGDGGTDGIEAGGGNDAVSGGTEADRIQGNAGRDTISGGDGDDQVTGGSDVGTTVDENVGSPAAGDTIQGDGGTDVIAGDNATISGTDITRFNDATTGDAQDDRFSGDDALYGDAGVDLIEAQGGNDVVYGDERAAAQATATGGADFVQGNAGRDTIYGHAGDDSIIGGSDAAGVVDADVGGAGDAVSGGTGIDYVLGDNGTLATVAGPDRRWRFWDLETSATAVDPLRAGTDAIAGNDDPDWIFGQSGNDSVAGGLGDDRIQGNAGRDGITGDGGADDVVGGSATHFVAGTETELASTRDDDDTISGSNADGTDPADAGDAVLGDNGKVSRLAGNDPNTGDASRNVKLYDVEIAGAAGPSADASGRDVLAGHLGRDLLFGQADDDTIGGQDGDDYIEGNAGAQDTLAGDAGNDDIIGGSSVKADGLVGMGGFPAATKAADGIDIVTGSTGDDAVMGDNGAIWRRTSGTGVWLTYPSPWNALLQRDLLAPSTAEPAAAFGNDTLDTGAGHDEVHGELGTDTIRAKEGDDTVISDLGKVTLAVLTGPARRINADGFITEDIDGPGTLRRNVELFVQDQAYGDVITGGDGNDVLHAGGGADTVDGNGDIKADLDGSRLAALTSACAATALACDKDVIFGGNGDDRMWGGPDHDHLYGGRGKDLLDVVTANQGDRTVDFKGADHIYGGFDADAMQADVSAPRPNGSDKLVDASGAFNAYYICEGAYGGNSVLRLISPSMLAFWQDLAAADGAKDVRTKASSGFVELAMVFTGDVKNNTKPVHPDTPGNFICSP